MVISHASAFDKIAATYDQEFSDSLVGQAQRNCVWEEMDRAFSPGERILEINCGTGVDATHLAQRGVEVFAYDASPAMVSIAGRRVRGESLQDRIRLGILPIENLARIEGESLFDGLLSDFGGLNCVEDLPTLARDAARLLKPNAPALVCVFGRYCAWEILWYLGQLNPRKSFRRLRPVVQSEVGHDAPITVYYHSLSAIRRAFEPHFTLERSRGIGIAVPPSYLEALARRFPGVLAAASRFDQTLGALPVWRNLADHLLLIFRRGKI
jgi:ubiquinone/menaquinone biosynthesis C-methylase UbiE